MNLTYNKIHLVLHSKIQKYAPKKILYPEYFSKSIFTFLVNIKLLNLLNNNLLLRKDNSHRYATPPYRQMTRERKFIQNLTY